MILDSAFIEEFRAGTIRWCGLHEVSFLFTESRSGAMIRLGLFQNGRYHPLPPDESIESAKAKHRDNTSFILQIDRPEAERMGANWNSGISLIEFCLPYPLAFFLDSKRRIEALTDVDLARLERVMQGWRVIESYLNRRARWFLEFPFEPRFLIKVERPAPSAFLYELIPVSARSSADLEESVLELDLNPQVPFDTAIEALVEKHRSSGQGLPGPGHSLHLLDL